ncbi:MAG: hypothetical protein ACP5JP_10920, partial [bacterium]
MKKFQLTVGNYKYWEYFDKVKNLSYFKMGGSHEIFKLENIGGPAVFCYCEIPGFLDFLRKNCENCSYKTKYYFKFDVQEEEEEDYPTCFYDWKDRNEILKNPWCQVVVNYKVAGIACRKMRVLHLT